MVWAYSGERRQLRASPLGKATFLSAKPTANPTPDFADSKGGAAINKAFKPSGA